MAAIGFAVSPHAKRANYVAIGIPTLLNAAMMGLFIAYIAYINARLTGFQRVTTERFDSMERRFGAIDRGFDDMRDLWRSELRRVEEVIDARLKHLEER
jgi:hypothetical protein